MQADIQTHFSLNGLKNIEQGYFTRLLRKRKTALDTSIGTNDLCLNQFLKNLCKKTSRNFIFRREFRY